MFHSPNLSFSVCKMGIEVMLTSSDQVVWKVLVHKKPSVSSKDEGEGTPGVQHKGGVSEPDWQRGELAGRGCGLRGETREHLPWLHVRGIWGVTL